MAVAHYPAATGDDEPPEAARAAPPPREPERRITRISSAQLFKGADELQIEHRGAVYRLRQTALEKLILTK